MKHKMIVAAASALALVAGASGVHAATASASLYGLKFTLVDLDTTDGVTPWITFGTSSVGAAAADVGSLDNLTSFGDSQQYGTSPFGAVVAAATLGNASANAAIGGLASPGGVTLTAVATATAPGVFSASTAGLGSDGTSMNFGGLSFTLSANTELMLTATASVWATSTETAFSLAYVEFLSAKGAVVDQDFAVSYFGVPSQTLGITFANAGDSDITGRFAAVVNSVAQGAAAPVPEPADTVLLAAGLGVLALLGRKRHTPRHKSRHTRR